MADSVSSRRCP